MISVSSEDVYKLASLIFDTQESGMIVEIFKLFLYLLEISHGYIFTKCFLMLSIRHQYMVTTVTGDLNRRSFKLCFQGLKFTFMSSCPYVQLPLPQDLIWLPVEYFGCPSSCPSSSQETTQALISRSVII